MGEAIECEGLKEEEALGNQKCLGREAPNAPCQDIGIKDPTGGPIGPSDMTSTLG